MEERFFETKYPTRSRAKEIEQLLSYVKMGNSAQIISLPGGGRSTLLGLLAYNQHVRAYHLKDQAERYHFVMVAFGEIRHKPRLEALKLIFLEIVNSLEDRSLDGIYEKAQQIMKENLSLNDELVLLQGLKKVVDMLTQEKRLHVVLLFDQFDTYIPMLTADFFSQLMILRNRAKYTFSIIFSTYKPLEDIVEPILLSDFAEFVQKNHVYLHMHDEPSLSFRIAYIEKTLGKALGQKARQSILDTTAGHAKLTRLCVETMLQENYELRITNYKTDFLSIKSIEKALEDIWQSLNPAEQTHFLKNLFPSVLDDEHSHYLKKVGLMTNDSIAVPLFAAYTDKKREKAKQEPSGINYRDLSDKLTATEFRLLQYFLQNPNTILQRNAIISGVWSENKTVLGVTDQALDQLIFRLRRKIEDDPNHPTHLQTVKGRGFKFTP